MQDAAVSRKDKLALLKKRKELHDTNPNSQFVNLLSQTCALTETDPREEGSVFKFRNYDPTTSTTKKHSLNSEMDTVEKQVEGLTEKAIAADELLRAQELVRPPFSISSPISRGIQLK